MNLDEIKQYLTEKNYDAVLITRNNHFLGQDVLETENRILALTGFPVPPARWSSPKKKHTFLPTDVTKYRLPARPTRKQPKCSAAETKR